MCMKHKIQINIADRKGNKQHIVNGTTAVSYTPPRPRDRQKTRMPPSPLKKKKNTQLLPSTTH